MTNQLTSRRDKPKRSPLKNSLQRLTVAEYLLKRINSLGASHFFTTPHPHLDCIHYYASHDPKIQCIHDCSAQAVTHLAEGFAKTRGISTVALIRESPGFIEAVLRCWSDSTPVIFILGTSIASSTALLDPHDHLEKSLRSLTVGWTVLDDSKLAAKKIDRIIDSCIHFQKPVCIELPQEIADEVIPPHTPQKTDFSHIDQNSLQDFLLDVDELLSKAKHPAIVQTGIVTAHKTLDDVAGFAMRYNIPIVAKTSHEADLLFVFGEYIPTTITYTHLVQVRTEDAFCDERHYTRLFFKDVMEGLWSLECRKRYKMPKQEIKAKQAKLLLIQQMLSKHTCQITCSTKLLSIFSTEHTILSSEKPCAPSYSIESAIGAKMALPLAPIVVLIDESELEYSLGALYFAKKQAIGLIVCVIGKKTRSTTSFDPSGWSLLELAHLLLEGNATQVETLRAFEKALSVALQTPKELFLIDYRL